MNLELSESFQSELDKSLSIIVTINCGDITLEDNNYISHQKSIKLSIKDFEKALCVYDAFLAAKEATGHDLEKLRQVEND